MPFRGLERSPGPECQKFQPINSRVLMRNVEIKAAVGNMAVVRRLASELSGTAGEKLEQSDTFFGACCANGTTGRKKREEEEEVEAEEEEEEEEDVEENHDYISICAVD